MLFALPESSGNITLLGCTKSRAFRTPTSFHAPRAHPGPTQIQAPIGQELPLFCSAAYLESPEQNLTHGRRSINCWLTLCKEGKQDNNHPTPREMSVYHRESRYIESGTGNMASYQFIPGTHSSLWTWIWWVITVKHLVLSRESCPCSLKARISTFFCGSYCSPFQQSHKSLESI